MKLLVRYQRGFIPHSNRRFGLQMACFAGYFFAYMLLVMKVPLGNLTRAQASTIWVSVLCFAALVTAMATDYSRRSLATRVLVVIGHMLAFGFILLPGFAWLGTYMSGLAPDAASARGMAVVMNCMAGYFPILFSLASSRLFARDSGLPLKCDPEEFDTPDTLARPEWMNHVS